MLKPVFSSRFKKDLKRYQHHKDILQEFNEVLKLLMNKKELTENIEIIFCAVITRDIENAM